MNDILLWLGEDTILAIVAVCHDGKIHYACKKYSNTDKYLKLALKLTNIINKGRISDDEIYSRIVHRQAEFGIVIQ